MLVPFSAHMHKDDGFPNRQLEAVKHKKNANMPTKAITKKTKQASMDINTVSFNFCQKKEILFRCFKIQERKSLT